MITAVDTSILIDILEADPEYGPASKEAYKRCLGQGAVVACEVVWAEAATAYGHAIAGLPEILNRINLQFSAITIDASLESARCWYAYRQQGGSRERIVADFLIGGHAFVQCDRLLARDQGFYRDCFEKLIIEVPYL